MFEPSGAFFHMCCHLSVVCGQSFPYYLLLFLVTLPSHVLNQVYMSLRGAIAFSVLGMLVLRSFAHSMSPVFPIMPSFGSDQVKLFQHECRRAFSFSFMAVLVSMFGIRSLVLPA
jgi:hypothetical protein